MEYQPVAQSNDQQPLLAPTQIQPTQPPMQPTPPTQIPYQQQYQPQPPQQYQQPITVGTAPQVQTQGAPISFGHMPQQVVCPNCQQTVLTTVKYENGVFSYLMCILICFFTSFFGCCCIGLIFLCIPLVQTAVHSCPECKRVIGMQQPK
ncbi:hypothetical protein EIN_154740 [Entamoeba invadens IP1]|uniref:LITAF domain-containing protein n=1 Tax=Entamoeba invadens IP1 TaxID=370355 RepID=A0A0A1U994_ENTIV|nr:hypothetical protein EIN_154740 [Entamoeba invadens IP1]ELP91397.1 hypothetical protein EIN_154740 [Entamoeba invadens IP1]|eukprot:XP_004258168.1 hypothetical protein EIN_154740 [Entamoeba invadens IP1]